MPTLALSLRSQRSKPVHDRVEFIEVRGRFSGPVNPSDIDLKPGEIVLDLVPDQYTVAVEIAGFKPAKGKVDVGTEAVARVFPLQNRVSTLPKVSELLSEQRRLLQTLDNTKTPGEIWDALSDNKAATFFQVTYALAEVETPDGAP